MPEWGTGLIRTVTTESREQPVVSCRPSATWKLRTWSLWLTNWLLHPQAAHFDGERTTFLNTLPLVTGKLILVSNETNMGIIPMGELSRRYCDEAGQLHQAVAQRCDQVILTAAGLPLVLKGEPL